MGDRPINRTTLSWLRHACRIAPHDVRDAARLEAADMVAHGDIDLMPPSLQRIGMRWGMTRPELHRCSIAATKGLTPAQAEAELHRRLTPTALKKHLRRRWPNASQRTIDQHVSNVALALPHRKRTPRQRKLDDWLRQTQRNARAQQWAHRIGQELQRTTAAGWHAVLCTLTIAPTHVPLLARQQGYAHADQMTAELLLQGLNPDGTRATGAGPWHRYREKVQEAVRQAYNHQPGDGPRLPQSTPAHQYCRSVAVIEHGKSRHHHHIHALFMCRAIPASWTRPNELRIRDRAGQIVTMAYRIGALESLWPWGISRCEPYRTLGDNWAPLIPHTAHGPKLTAPIHSGAYLAKYLRKESSLWPHRVRATHGLGLTGLRRYIA
ncbi:MAG: hypothetical protein OXT70_03445, partial [Chloroflexota bacterium]|nr:hypothetical protein [Chloroflexota bacterium]